MKKIKKFAPLFLIIWIGLILGLSSIPNMTSRVPLTRAFGFKMVAHISAYAVLTFLLITGVGFLFRLKANKALMWAVFFAFLCALLNEYYQKVFIPTRGGRLRDVGIDGIGILITAGIWAIFKIKKRKKEK